MIYDALLKYADTQVVAGVTPALSDRAVEHRTSAHLELADFKVEFLPKAVTGADATKIEILGADAVDGSGDLTGTTTVIASVTVDLVAGKPVYITPSQPVSPYTQLRVTNALAGDSVTFEAGLTRAADVPYGS